ncbi:MAG: glycerophosphodiester phosphodiesterase [Rhodospirillales bacterium]|jgi:glycerophosphoryl diester phosphodiesterase|nr:glycerophosphodiester phosphodiesterase [Rhodospirillales bacterium]
MRLSKSLVFSLLGVLCLAIMMQPPAVRAEAPIVAKPIVIGHRGASGYIPEHTIAAYAIAIEQGADFIEPDLVMTKDGVLVARHENEIGGTTDVASRPEFASRFTTKTIDGFAFTGWFTEDFTLAELKTLRARERLPSVRTGSTAFDGHFSVPTFEEVLVFVRATNDRFKADARRSRGAPARQIGVYPETKHPTYHRQLGFAMEEALVAVLRRQGFSDRRLVFIQSFEVGNLKQLSRLTPLPLVQLINAGGQPYDFTVSGDPRTYADLVTPAGLAEIATYAHGIGVNKSVLFPRDGAGNIGEPSDVIANAHAARLIVHGWTFRAENQFLPANFRNGTDANAFGDLAGEIGTFLDAGMDGFFTDHPNIGVAARDTFLAAP